MSKKSKQKTKSTRAQTQTEEQNKPKQINALLGNNAFKFDLYAILALLFLVIIYFWPVLIDGKVFLVPDNTTSFSSRSLVAQANEEGIFPLWTPYIFSGMPSYGSLMVGGDRSYDFFNLITQKLIRFLTFVFESDSAYIINYYFFLGLGIYWLLRLKNASQLTALFSAIGVTFSTLSLVWITVGHNTKIITIAVIPFLLLLAEKVRQEGHWKQILLNTALLGLLFQMLFRSTHVQMIYYTAMTLAIFFLFDLISSLIKKSPISVWLRSVSSFAIAALIGLSMSADTYLSILDYTPHSIRGSESITKTYPELSTGANVDKASAESGLSYEYATNWSFPPSEIITFLVPSFYGYGDQTYWGEQLFTHSPNFFGALILVLAIIGFIYNRSNHFVQALGLIAILSLLISFGKHFSLIFDLLFYYLPFFNKFRAPSMILILVQIASCVLAGYGLKSLIELYKSNDAEAKKVFTYLALGSGILFVISLVGINLLQDAYFNGIAKSNIGKQLLAKYGGQVPNVIERYGQPIFDMMKTDAFITLFLIAALFTGAHFLLQQKLSPVLFQMALIPMLIVDLGRADMKLLKNLNDPQEQVSFFKSTPDIEFLQTQQQNSKFRILPLTPDRKSSWYAYFNLESVGGYHAAKMRLYQDLIEVVGGGSTEYPAFYKSPAMMDLLNIRYIILNQQASLPGYTEVFADGKIILERNNWTKRAWFVDSLAVKPPNEIITAIKASSYDPKRLALVEDELEQVVIKPDSTSYVKLVDSGIHQLTFEVKASGRHFMHLSEIYYPAGWLCTVDDEQTPIIKTNYAFRGVVVPKGKHTVKFEFKPASFTLGKTISLVTNILVLLVFVFLAADKFRDMKKSNP